MGKNSHLKWLTMALAGTLLLGGIATASPVAEKTGQNKDDVLLKGEITLQQLVNYAYKHNPSLKAARMRWAAVIERHPQATAYEDPLLQYAYFIESPETRVGPQEQKFAISQKIPFPGKLTLKGEIVAQEVKMARQEFEKQTRDLIVELKDAYYELAYINKAIELTRQNKELLQHLANIGTTEYSLDGTTLNDVFQAQSQLAQISYDLILLTEFKSSEITRINALLNRPPETPMGEPRSLGYRPLNYSLEELYQLALKNQQELNISELDITRQSKKIDLAEMEYLPNFKVGFDYIDVGNASTPNIVDSGQDAYAVSVGISIPLWFDKNRARVNEAKSEYEAAVYKKKELENRAFSSVKTLYFKLQNSARLVRLYRDSLVPQAAESMETAETWFKTRKGSFSGLLETQAVWLNFNLALQRALADYHQRIALMERVVGTGLPLSRPKHVKGGTAK